MINYKYAKLTKKSFKTKLQKGGSAQPRGPRISFKNQSPSPYAQKQKVTTIVFRQPSFLRDVRPTTTFHEEKKVLSQEEKKKEFNKRKEDIRVAKIKAANQKAAEEQVKRTLEIKKKNNAISRIAWSARQAEITRQAAMLKPQLEPSEEKKNLYC